MIINHFPPNSRFVVKGTALPKGTEFGLRFAVLLERYANIIRGLMYGHNHEDFFEMSNSFVNGQPLLVGFSHPALGT